MGLTEIRDLRSSGALCSVDLTHTAEEALNHALYKVLWVDARGRRKKPRLMFYVSVKH